MLQWWIFYRIAKDPDHWVKIGQDLVFSFLLPFVIYLSGFDLFNFSKIPMMNSLDILSWGTPLRNYIKWYDFSVIKRAAFSRNISMVASVSKRLWSRILKSPPKLSKTLATMKHYKKMFLIKQFLRNAFSLYFGFLLSKF